MYQEIYDFIWFHIMTTRASIIFSVALIAVTVSIIYMFDYMGRFQVFPHDKGLFILDSKTQVINYCTESSCKVVPHKENDVYSAVPYRDVPMPSMRSLSTVGQYPIVIYREPPAKIEEKVDEKVIVKNNRGTIDTNFANIAPQQMPAPVVQQQLPRQSYVAQPMAQQNFMANNVQPFNQTPPQAPQNFQDETAAQPIYEPPQAPVEQPMMPMDNPQQPVSTY